jgi:hypothetical protein
MPSSLSLKLSIDRNETATLDCLLATTFRRVSYLFGGGGFGSGSAIVFPLEDWRRR